MSTRSPCPCDGPQDPQVVTNPPNLPTIAYRVGDFTAFRRALLTPLAGETALAGWRPAPGDLGLQVLEWWAYLADILTFYNERIANESYLGTAELPGSVAGLVALLGYQPRPGIAATGTLGAIRSAKNLGEPLVIAAGTQFANQATPGVPVQTYEATTPQTFTSPVSDTTVIPAADSDLPHVDPNTGAASVLLAGKVGGVAAGDALLLLRRGWAGGDENWARVTVGAVAPEASPYGPTNTRVTFSSISWGLQVPPPEPTRFFEMAVFQRFTHDFDGYDPTEVTMVVDPLRSDPPPAPPEDNPQVESYRLLRPLQTASLWSGSSDTATTGSYSDATFAARLSAVVRAITPGDPVLFNDASTPGAVLALVSGTSEEMLTVAYPDAPPPKPPTIPVAHSVLTLTLPSVTDADSLDDLSATATAVRYAFRDVGTMIASPASTMPPLPATFTPLASLPPLDTVPVLLEDATGAGVTLLASTNSDGTVLLGLPSGAPSPPALRLPVRLLIDLVPISQGASVAAEALGTGDATLAGQTFGLSKSPLTYLPSANGFASTLKVAVDGIYWTEVASFYGQPADALIFTVSQPGDGTSVVRFGDGVQGARLPTGSQVIAGYRYGSGATSPPAGRLTTILRPQTNLTAVHNPVAVAGGEDPEPPSSMRAAGPATVLTFGRAISVDDYETVAAHAVGVDRVRAYWTWDATVQRATIKIYVGGDSGAQGAAKSALAGSEDPNRRVLVEQANAIALDLSCGLVIATDAVPSGVIAAAQASVAELFSPASMRIGQTLYSSQIEAALMVPGVTAVQGLSVLVPNQRRFERVSFLSRRFGFGQVPEEIAPLGLFAGPVGSADPGEGAFYALAGTPNIAQVGSGD